MCVCARARVCVKNWRVQCSPANVRTTENVFYVASQFLVDKQASLTTTVPTVSNESKCRRLSYS